MNRSTSQTIKPPTQDIHLFAADTLGRGRHDSARAPCTPVRIPQAIWICRSTVSLIVLVTGARIAFFM
jgi:hypothetical protein